MIIADLHIHSRFSRATARNLDPEHLWVAAQLKGVDLLGTGDFTHPAWIDELEQKLQETGDGAYELIPDLARTLEPEVPGPCRRPVRFLLSAEISSIYKRDGKTRKVHSLILMPDFAAAKRLNARLGRLGNIESDGRPILGLDAQDLLEICLEVEPDVIFIPAHIWTPWFSVFGSKSGFDSLTECFGELTGHIHALETGLSSDPAMNWRLSALDNYTLVSHSDAHSPAKLAREANLLNCEPTYPALAAALADRQGDDFAGTLEFYPDEGKYHLDGHRKCGVRLEPQKTRELGAKCPVCGGPLTVGVMSRVEDLADRPPGARPPKARPFESVVPLAEVAAEVVQQGPATKKVTQMVRSLVLGLGPELFVLRQAPLEDIGRIGGPVMAEAIRRMRSGKVRVESGFDGQFGVVRLFDAAERQKIKGQKGFWELAPDPARKKPETPAPAAGPKAVKKAPVLIPLDPAKEGLNPEQARAVEHRGGPLLVRAGPGTGKTRVLVQRAVSLLEEGIPPESILMITFTNKAAGELKERLAAQKTAASKVKATTFHSLGIEILSDALDGPVEIAGEQARLNILTPLAKQAGLTVGDLSLGITRFKQSLEAEIAPEMEPALAAYQEALADQGLFDLDDLVREAAFRLHEDPGLASVWRGRFAHVLVDEYQDVNPAQVALLKRLCGPDTQLTAIGDPDQAIYGFRGADRRFFQLFALDFPGQAEMGLGLNYRGTKAVLAAAQGLIEHEPDPGRGVLKSVRGPGVKPVRCSLATPQAEARWVAEKVAALLGGLDSRQVEGGLGLSEEDGFAALDIAVLYRLHAQAPPLLEAFKRVGVPVQVAAKEPLAETDPMDFKAQRVSLLTMHAAKGLEWPVVFVVGLEDGILPYLPPNRPPADKDEERRLLFVAMTRARRLLFLSRAQKRTLYGKTRQPAPSLFWTEIPSLLVKTEKAPARKLRARQMDMFG